jgi:hypothetical protein
MSHSFAPDEFSRIVIFENIFSPPHHLHLHMVDASEHWTSQPLALVAAAAAYRARAALYRLRRYAPELGLAAATFDDGCDDHDGADAGDASKQGGDDEKETVKGEAGAKKGGDWDRPLRDLFGGAQASLYVCFCLFFCVSWDLFELALDD